MWFYIDDNGQAAGPYREVELEVLIRTGKIGPRTLVRNSADTSWMETRSTIEYGHLFQTDNREEYSNAQGLGSNIKTRMKYLVRGCICLFLTILFGNGLYTETTKTLSLYFGGQEAIAAVVDYKHYQRTRKGRTRTSHSHALNYDGHINSVTLDRQYPLGTTFRILYIPRDPSVIKYGDRSSSFWDLLSQDIGWFLLVIITFGFPICGYFTIRNFLIVYKGEKTE